MLFRLLTDTCGAIPLQPDDPAAVSSGRVQRAKHRLMEWLNSDALSSIEICLLCKLDELIHGSP